MNSWKKVTKLFSVLDLKALQNQLVKKLDIFILTNSIEIDRRQILTDKTYCQDKKVVVTFFNTDEIQTRLKKMSKYKGKENHKIMNKRILTFKINNQNIHMSEHLRC